MAKEYSPFTPGVPVPIEFFVDFYLQSAPHPTAD